ncbi:MAG: M20/M25/M40 family metallo-hydrolase [Deltaproteobacteria bacterium]|nr:M20/M25/M40 family metallo-hydrolase [Deltaproteobacteria bacterium]
MDPQLLEWCRRLLACRSVTSEGTRDIVQLCAYELLQPHHLEARVVPSQSEGPSQTNLICIVRGREHECAPLILNTHLDTVPPGDAASWTECPDGPFVPTFKGERIYGLGAADTKLDFVAKTLALIECGTPRRDVYLIGTFGEEHGLVGAKELAATGILPKGALAFIGEPSRLQIITAHKGLMVFELEIDFASYNEAQRSFPVYHLIFEGRSAHSSTPALGVNAIQLAVEALRDQRDLHVASINGGDVVNKVPALCKVTIGGELVRVPVGGTRVEPGQHRVTDFVPYDVFSLLSMFLDRLATFAKRAGRPEPDYAPPTLTFNPGVIRSNRQSISLEFEFRPPPSLPLDKIRDGVAEAVGLLSRSYPDQKINVTERRANPAFRSSLEGETAELAMAALAAANLPLEAGVKAGCTEAGVYANAGVSPVVFGPGPSTGVIHAPNEYNLVSEVEGAMRFYRELLRL